MKQCYRAGDEVTGPIPVVPAILFRVATEAVVKTGTSSERIVERADLPMWQLYPDGTKIPGSHFFRLMNAAARALGDEAFGVFVAEHVPLSSLGSIGAKICNAETVYDSILLALKLISKGQNTSRFWVIENEEEIWWFRQTAQDFGCGAAQCEIQTIRLMIDAVRANAGQNWIPSKICLETAPIPKLRTISAFANSEIRYRQPAGGFAIPKSHLALHKSHNYTVANDKILDVSPSMNFTDSVRQIARALIVGGDLNIETLAEAAGLHKRTLQRRLAGEDINFKTLVNQARYQASLDRIHDADISFSEIAHDLGYADQAHFSRAFRRWSGTSPTEYRRLHVTDPC